MPAVRARNVLLSQRLPQLAAVVREDVDLIEGFVDDPHAMFRIVRADTYPMGPWSSRAFAQVIPLRPALLDLTIAVDGVEAVAPDPTVGGVEHVDPDRSRITREL